jgi:uncharacterized protein with PhoU and TrkA domain
MKDIKLSDMIKHLLKEEDETVSELQIQKNPEGKLKGLGVSKLGTSKVVQNVMKVVMTRTSDLSRITDSTNYKSIIAQITDAIRNSNNDALTKQEILSGLRSLVQQYSEEG